MLPMLELSSDGVEYSMQEAREILAQNLRLTEQDLEKRQEKLQMKG